MLIKFHNLYPIALATTIILTLYKKKLMKEVK